MVRRKQILNDALEQFDFCDKAIYVRYDGENGEDADGLSRAIFSDFWDEFFKVYGKGRGSSQYITISPDNLPSGAHLKAAGRILILGYILNDYIPYFINKAQLFSLFTMNSPSDSLIEKSFLDCLDESSRGIISSGLNSLHFTEDQRMALISIFANFETSSLPRPETLTKIVHNTARYLLLVKPFFFLHQMREGILEVKSSPFLDISEELFISLMDSFMPSGAEIVKALTIKYSGSPNLYGFEEKVAGFLECFLLTLTQKEAAVFMRFVSGNERVSRVIVEFNGAATEERMIPRSNTCSVTLHVSRCILTQDQFDKLFSFLFLHKEFWNQFDSI